MRAKPISDSVIRVWFDREVSMTDPDCFYFEPDTLKVIGVLRVDNKTLDLLTTKQDPDTRYVLHATEDQKDGQINI